jgi:GT2 family glycosyltransferase
MAQTARGEYLLLLNNDAELFPDALNALYAEAQIIGEPAILGLPQYDAANGELIDRGSLFDPFLNPIPNFDLQRTDVGMIIGACLWTPRTLWEEIGGFPEWFHTLAEDMYLCCAARMQGYSVRVLPMSGFSHWVGKSLGGGKVTSDKRLVTSLKRRALSERNKSFVMVIFYPTPLLQLALPIHLLALAAEGLLLSLLKHDYRLWREIYWRCFTSLGHKRELLAAARRSIQAKRQIGIAMWLTPFTILPHKLQLLLRYGLPDLRR